MINAYERNGNGSWNNISANAQTYILLLNAFKPQGNIDDAKNIWQNEINDNKIGFDSYAMASLIDGVSWKGMLNE